MLDPDNPGPVGHACVEIDDRRRFTLPTYIISQIDWLTDSRQTREALAVLVEPGKVILHSWQLAAPLILEKRKELLHNFATSFDARDALKLLEDRYKIFTFPKLLTDSNSVRPTIPLDVLFHLQIELNPKGVMHIFRVENSLELLSEKWRATFREQNRELLDGLP